VTARKGLRGYDDVQMIVSLILRNLAGGEVVDDIEQVEKDRGSAEVLEHLELHDLSRQRRRELLRRWRRTRTRVSPSPSTVFRYLDAFRVLDQGRHPRFGRIESAISVPVDKEFKTSVAEMNRLHDEEPEPRGKVKVSPWKPLVGPKGTW